MIPLRRAALPRRAPPSPSPDDDPAGALPPLSEEDRDLIVRYMVLRALARLELAPAGRTPPAPARRRRRPHLRSRHARR